MDKHDDTAASFKYRDTSASQPSRRFQTKHGAVDSKAVQVADFVDRVPFQLFMTLRPIHEMSIVSLKGQLKDVVNRIEKYYKASLSYVVGYESEPEVHCHACFASSVKLQPEIIILSLQKKFNADIQEIYSSDVLTYVLKCIKNDGDWDFGNLDLYLKAVTEGNHKQRRRIGRHNRRLIMEKLNHG